MLVLFGEMESDFSRPGIERKLFLQGVVRRPNVG